MRTTASPSSSTFTRQSTRASPLGSISTDCVGSGRRASSIGLCRESSVSPSIAVQFQHDLHGLLRLQVVMHVGREHDLVLLDEEPRGLQADDEVLAGDDVGLALADLGAVAHAPDLDPPGGQVLGHVERDLGRAVLFGRQRADPEGRVGELRADGRLRPSALRRRSAGFCCRHLHRLPCHSIGGHRAAAAMGAAGMAALRPSCLWLQYAKCSRLHPAAETAHASA